MCSQIIAGGPRYREDISDDHVVDVDALPAPDTGALLEDRLRELLEAYVDLDVAEQEERDRQRLATLALNEIRRERRDRREP